MAKHTRQAMRVPTKPRTHPANHQRNNKALEDYVFTRIDSCNTNIRTELCRKFEFIDKEVNTFLLLSKEDQERMREQLLGKSLKPTDHKLPLIFTQLDDAVTFIMDVFNPSSKLFQGIGGNLSEQQVTNAFTDLLNNHAQEGQYFRHIARSVFSGLKYNIGGVEVFWKENKGTIVGTRREDQSVELQEGEITSAMNKIRVIDPYNFIWDPNSDLVDIPYDAEWAATIEIKTKFYLERLKENEAVYNTAEIDKLSKGLYHNYYKRRPKTRDYFTVSDDADATNWEEIGRQIRNEDGKDIAMTGKYELIKWTGWLNPKDFGLADTNKLRIWRLIYLVDNEHKILVWDNEKKDAHNLLPYCMNMPIESELEFDQKSYGEHLMAFQTFSSFLMNAHQRATRKALYGITVYNPNVVDLSQLGDDVVGAIPFRSNVYDKAIKDSIAQFHDAPQTENNIVQISNMNELMQYILPTDQRRTVSNLQRATRYQASASVQGHNRRSYKIAKVIDVQEFTPMKAILLSNIQQYQQALTIINAEGKEVEIDPAKFREGKIYYNIGGALKGLDKLLTIDIIEKVISNVIQNQQASAEMDVPGLINYLSSLAGEEADLTRFRRTPEDQQRLLELQRPAGLGAQAATEAGGEGDGS